MKKLFLANLKGYSEAEVAEHLIQQYGASPKEMSKYHILIAYESVGDYGCDSTSFFLLEEKQAQNLLCVYGSHCSCHGFEDQFCPEETTLKYLKSSHFSFYCGGYDEQSTDNKAAVKKYIDEYQPNIWHDFFD